MKLIRTITSAEEVKLPEEVELPYNDPVAQLMGLLRVESVVITSTNGTVIRFVHPPEPERSRA